MAVQSSSVVRVVRPPRRVRPRQHWPALYVLGYFLVMGLGLWWFDGQAGQFVLLALIGLVTGGGFLFHELARPRLKPLARKVSVALVGLSLFVGAGVFGRQSFQLEGFFFHVLGGVLGGVGVHYLVAKIVGPLFIGRAWCSWGCWIWMVLDRLPWHRSPGRSPEWGWLRGAHFALSLGLVALLTWGLGYRHGFEWETSAGLWWFLEGCALYYALGIGLAAALGDNRAFCKYLCPVTVFLRAGTRVSLLRVEGDASVCAQCQACDRVCPMDVPVSAFVNNTPSGRVASTECTLCLRCVSACTQSTLRLTVGLDVARGEPPRLDAPHPPRSARH